MSHKSDGMKKISNPHCRDCQWYDPKKTKVNEDGELSYWCLDVGEWITESAMARRCGRFLSRKVYGHLGIYGVRRNIRRDQYDR